MTAIAFLIDTLMGYGATGGSAFGSCTPLSAFFKYAGGLAMGLAVLPARLKKEMSDLERAILSGEDLRQNEAMASHADWAEEWIPKYDITSENIHSIVQKEIGIVFTKVLEDAGVYKRTPDGIAAFNRFIDDL